MATNEGYAGPYCLLDTPDYILFGALHGLGTPLYLYQKRHIVDYLRSRRAFLSTWRLKELDEIEQALEVEEDRN